MCFRSVSFKGAGNSWVPSTHSDMWDMSCCLSLSGFLYFLQVALLCDLSLQIGQIAQNIKIHGDRYLGQREILSRWSLGLFLGVSCFRINTEGLKDEGQLT